MADQTAPLDESGAVAILAQPDSTSLKQWRDEQMPERRLYKTTGFEDTVPDAMFPGADAPADRRAAAVTNLRNMLADTGLSPADARHLLSRAGAVRAADKDDEAQRREARKVLEQTFGAGADAALADAKKLIARDSRFSKYITRKGIGNDAETIVILARAARSQRAAGKLK